MAAIGAFAIAAAWAAAQRLNAGRGARRGNFSAGAQALLTLSAPHNTSMITASSAIVRHAARKKDKKEKAFNKAMGGGLESDEDMVGALGAPQSSFLANLEAQDQDEAADAEAIEEEMKKEDDLFTAEDANIEVEEMSEEELARRGERQVVFKLYPSRQYVQYIAKKNAERNWTKDGPDGRNKGCLEVQIAILTERIRAMVMHLRENKHDYKCRVKLVILVARRRAYLDKLSWKNLDSYLKVREALKIRHVYRMEALIGRLGQYKYPNKDRKQAPGRKVAMRLKKKGRLLERRLASQLRQGRQKRVIHKTKRAIRSRNWLSRPYDDVEAMRSGKAAAPRYINPLNLP
jgi:small subunit ribosomal protein S15